MKAWHLILAGGMLMSVLGAWAALSSEAGEPVWGYRTIAFVGAFIAAYAVVARP